MIYRIVLSAAIIAVVLLALFMQTDSGPQRSTSQPQSDPFSSSK